MKKALKAFISLVLSMLIVSTTITVYADYNGDSGGAGSVGGSGSWSENAQGYRFSIVDANTKKTVSNTLDLVNIAVQNSNIAFYYNNKFQSLSTVKPSGYYRAVIKEFMTKSEDFDPNNLIPLYTRWQGSNAINQGEAVKAWLLKGDKIQGAVQSTGAVYYNNSSSSGSSSGSSGSSSSSGGGHGQVTTNPSSGGSTYSQIVSGNRSSIKSTAVKAMTHLEFEYRSMGVSLYSDAYRLVGTTTSMLENGSYYIGESAACKNAYNYLEGCDLLNCQISYILASAIDNAFGSHWRLGQTAFYSDEAPDVPVLGNANGSEKPQLMTDTTIKDEAIPLSSNSADNDGYIYSILNYKLSNGNYLFTFNDSKYSSLISSWDSKSGQKGKAISN